MDLADVLAKTLEGIFIVGALAVLFFPLTVCIAGFVYEMGRWFHRWHVRTRKPGWDPSWDEPPTPCQDRGMAHDWRHHRWAKAYRCTRCRCVWDLSPRPMTASELATGYRGIGDLENYPLRR